MGDFFFEVSSRIRRGFGEAIVPVCRDFDGALGKPFLPACKVAFSSGLYPVSSSVVRLLVVRLRPTTGLPQADHRPLRLGQLLPKYEAAHLQKLVRLMRWCLESETMVGVLLLVVRAHLRRAFFVRAVHVCIALRSQEQA